VVSRGERQQAATLDGIAQVARPVFAPEWVQRIADELRLSELSKELLLTRLCECGAERDRETEHDMTE
jgi:hypothetical protein